MSGDVEIDRPVVKWGNSYGIRLTQSELKRLGIRPGDHVRGRLTSDAVQNDLDRVRFLRLGLPSERAAIDQLLDDDLLDEQEAG